jgi:hypothetical protein
MGTGALIRGGAGSEISLRDVIAAVAPHLTGFCPRSKAEPIARKWEADNPGSVVVCDWEVIPDEDINGNPVQGIQPMSAAEKQRALADRAFLAQRREAAKAVKGIAPPVRGGDPQRMAEQLARLRNDMAHLETTHPQYERVFTDWTNQIHQIEDALGQPRTAYKIGYKAPLEGLTKEQRDALKSEVARYGALKPKQREAAIAAATDPTLTQFMLDSETDATLRAQLVAKLAQMAASK